MSRAVPSSQPEAKPFSYRERLREISMFFDGTDKVHETMRRISAVLEAAEISYAIIGGMAVNAHRHKRTTGDVDFLLRAEGVDALIRLVDTADIERVPGRPRRFLDRTTGITFDTLVTGRFPGDGRPKAVAFPDPDDVAEVLAGRRTVNLPTLIQLKLASGRYKDFGDVVELIRANDLNESFQDKIDPSVRGDFIECLEERRREDEYEAREDEFARRLEREGNGGS
jgi:hypothetical protein